jgi:hypothetical protein
MAQAASLWDEDDYIEQQIKEIIEWANSNMQWGTLSGNLVQTLVASLNPEIDYRCERLNFRRRTMRILFHHQPFNLI